MLQGKLLSQIVFIFIFIKLSLSSVCTQNSVFETIQPNVAKYFKTEPGNDICLQYKLYDSKTDRKAIGIYFPNTTEDDSKTEVSIYELKSVISFGNGIYQNTFERYNITENKFPSINTNMNKFDDYCYIIIRNVFKEYTSFIKVFDSKIEMPVTINEPVDIKYFTHDNIYNFYLTTNKIISLVFNSLKKNKQIAVTYDGLKSIDGNYQSFSRDFNPNGNNKKLQISITQNDQNLDTHECSFICHEKQTYGSENIIFHQLKSNEIKTVYYISATDATVQSQKFYFYADISGYTNSSSVVLELDSQSKNYITLTSNIVNSDTELQQNDLVGKFSNTSELPTSRISDEYLTIYFHNNQTYKYSYLLISVEIGVFNEYYEPKSFNIFLGNLLYNTVDLTNISYFETHNYSTQIEQNVLTYFQFLLDKNSNYLLTADNKKNIILVNGDFIINNDTINENYLNDENKDIILLSGVEKLSAGLFGNKGENNTFYIEKISSDVEIIKNNRSQEAIVVSMDENDCTSKNKKYVLGIYDKNTYSNKINTIYGIADLDSDFNLYYKNTIDIDNTSLFPSSNEYNKQLEKVFLQNNSLDFFTITCNKPGKLYIRPLRKTFEEKTHLIHQNSINNIKLVNHTEILQLSSSVKRNDNKLYLLILSKSGNEITITPDNKELFSEKKISGNDLFTQVIDTEKYKMDQLAIKITSNDTTDIEVIEVIHQNYTKYENIDDNKEHNVTLNNMVKFINGNFSQANITIQGLENEKVYYGIVELVTNDTNYLPPAYLFKENIESKKLSENETIVINNSLNNNTFYDTNDDRKKYQAVIFSIFTAKNDKQYKIQFNDDGSNEKEEDKDQKKTEGGLSTPYLIAIIVIILILLIIIIIIIIICIKKKKKNENNIDELNNSNKDAQLYPINSEKAEE